MAMRKPGYDAKKRDSGNRKRNAVVLINAEGRNKTETNYLRKFANRKAQIHFISGRSTDPVRMIGELIDEMRERGFDKNIGDRAFCLIDSDVNPTKDQRIAEADRLAKKEGDDLIVSAPCFENWFLCHFVFSTRRYDSNDELIRELRKYIKDYSKNSANLYELLFSMTDTAIENAKKQEFFLIKNGRKKHTVEFMPSTEAYLVVEGIRKIKQINQ